MDKIKTTNDDQIFLEIKVYLVHDIEGFVLFCDNALFHQFNLLRGGGVRTPHMPHMVILNQIIIYFI